MSKSIKAEIDCNIINSNTKIHLTLFDDKSINFSCDNISRDKINQIEDVLDEIRTYFTPQAHGEQPTPPPPVVTHTCEELKTLWINHCQGESAQSKIDRLKYSQRNASSLVIKLQIGDIFITSSCLYFHPNPSWGIRTMSEKYIITPLEFTHLKSEFIKIKT